MQQVISNTSHRAKTVEAADLDGDGVPDVLCASENDHTVSWHQNLGGGAFGPEQVISSSVTGARCATAADLDGDGDLDVLSASGTNDVVAWYENLGGGSFGPSQALAGAINTPFQVRTADTDGDGDLDVLATSFGTAITMWKNLGGGQFGAPQAVLSGVGASSQLDAADLDGDGDEDLVVTLAQGDRVVWLENTGAGSFGPQQLIVQSIDGLHAVRAAHMDSDGDLDLLVGKVDIWGEGRVYLFENLGGGVFAPLQVVTENALEVRSVLPVDVDGNGSLDVVYACSGNASRVGLCWNDPNHIDDCNGNGIDDELDIQSGVSVDCDGDLLPDECQIAVNPSLDWDGNGVLDSCSSDPVTCAANPNFVSATGGVLAPYGSPVLAQNSFVLTGSQLPPGMPGFYICSRTAGFVNPFGGGSGVLCMGAPIRRLDPLSGYPLSTVHPAGFVNVTVDLTNVHPQVQLAPGDSLHFQFWHREPDGQGGMTSNTSNGILVMFR